MAVKIISDLSVQKTGHIRVILGGAYVEPTPPATQTQTPTKTPTPTPTPFDCYTYQLTTGPSPIGSTDYAFTCCKSGFIITGTLGAGDSIQPCARNNSVSAGPAVTIVKSTACSSDNIGSCIPPTTTPTNTQTKTLTPTITPTPSVASCNVSKTGSYAGNDYHNYSNQNLSDSMDLYISFNWNSYDRPNRFTVYDSIGLRWTSGWVGTASYPGPWGPSLNTAQTGFANICFLSSTGRYVLVEAGPANPSSPISDTYNWDITCLSPICPSQTPTPTQTPSNTTTPTVTKTQTPTYTSTPTPTNGVKCNQAATYEGGESYPTTQNVVLGSDTGTVILFYNAFSVPDRYIVYFDSIAVIDTGYVGSAEYNIGGPRRTNFNAACLGKVDPLTGLQYPNAGATDVAADGYPIVSSPGDGDASFSKETATTTAEVRVYAPVGGTVWDYTLTCPEFIPT